MVNQSKVQRAVAIITTIFILALMPNIAQASLITYQMNLDGFQEVGIGDLDGSATGSISFNDVTGLVSWDLLFADIDSPVAMHIHGPGGFAGVNAGVFLPLGVNTTGLLNTLTDSLVMNINDMNMITSDPAGFYINIHTAEFPPGAVRGQLGNITVPEPATMSLVLIAALLLFGRIQKKNFQIDR